MINDKDIAAMRRCARDDKPFRSYVELTLSEIIDGDVESVNDAVSMRATGSLVAQDIQWQIVDFTKETVILAVSLDVKEVIKELNEFQLQY